MGSAHALKCNGNELELWLAGHLEKSSVHWKEETAMLMCRVVYIGKECTQGVLFFLIDH